MATPDPVGATPDPVGDIPDKHFQPHDQNASLARQVKFTDHFKIPGLIGKM